LVSSFALTTALLVGCSNDSPSNSGNSGGGSGAATSGAGGQAGSTDASGGSSATSAGGEAGSTDASGGSFATGGSGGTEETGGTGGGNPTGGSGGGGTGGDATGGTGVGGTGVGGSGGGGGTGAKGGLSSPNVGCTGSVGTDSAHELTSCGLSVSKVGSQTQFSLGLQGKDENNDGLTVTLAFTDVPTATTYTFASSDYTNFNSTWNESTTIYTATAADGFAGVGSLSVEIDSIDGPFAAGSTTFYTVSGSIKGSLVTFPTQGMASLDIKF
jgi:hypothetical protein